MIPGRIYTKCQRHQIAACKACVRKGYSNVTLVPPGWQKPHIAFMLGYWRVSALSPVLKGTKTKADTELVLDRWTKAQQLVSAWNAYTDQHARMNAPRLWKPVPL